MCHLGRGSKTPPLTAPNAFSPVVSITCCCLLDICILRQTECVIACQVMSWNKEFQSWCLDFIISFFFCARFRSLSTSTAGGASRSSSLKSALTKPPPGPRRRPSRPPPPLPMLATTTHLAPPSQVDLFFGASWVPQGALSI